MKNLYKIEDELYIISNSENVNENCWIITDDKLVQVSYLLSDEVAKGNKVILTTNKLLIKDGVQAIDDEFLEFIVKNPSCESVETKLVEFEVDMGLGDSCVEYGNYYKIIILKEEQKQHIIDIMKSDEELGLYEQTKCYCGHTTTCWHIIKGNGHSLGTL